MRRDDLILDPDDPYRASVVIDELIERIGLRLPELIPDADADQVDDVLSMIETIADYKLRDGDARLGTWSVPEVTELLLAWCPRELNGPGADWAALPIALDILVDTLDLADLLDTPGSAVGAVRAEILRCRAEFVDAMDDPSRWGVAKSLVGSVTDGVDHPPRRQVPAVVLPPTVEVIESAAAAPVLARLRALADFYGDGRPVTQTGNPRLADAAVLVERLGTADRIDEAIGDRVFKTKSAAELPELRLALTLARKAGVVRLAKGRLSATKVGRSFGDDPVASLRRVWDAVVSLGPIAATTGPRGVWFREVANFLDDELEGILSIPYVEDPVPVEAVAEQAGDVVLSVFEFRHPMHDEAFVRRHVAHLVRRMLALTDHVGVTRQVRLDEAEPEIAALAEAEGITALVGLTPVGRVLVRDLLLAEGWDAPATEAELTDLPLDEMLVSLADGIGLLEARGELDAWVSARTPEQILDEVRAVVGVAGAPGLWAAALKMLTPAGVGTAAVTAYLAELEAHADPTVRAIVRWWQVSDAGADPSTVRVAGDELAWLHALGLAVADGGYDTGPLSADEEDPAEMAALFDACWRDPSPFTTVALDQIGSGHPHAPTAKAARKACLRRRTAGLA